MDNLEESQDAINKRFADALLPLTITFGVFMAIGIVGNILVLLVYSFGREYRNNNFRIFVICLGIIDLLTCAILFPAEMIKHRNFFSFESIVMCKLKCFLNIWAACAAALTLFIISVDRYRKVCQPLKKQISPKLALILCILLSFVIPLILSTPGAVMCGIKTANKTNIYNTSTSVYLCETEEKYAKSKFRTLYKFTFMILLVGISLACIIMYILIGRQIFRHWGSQPVSFRKDSAREFNSDYSSDTFGNMRVAKKSLEPTSSASDSQSQLHSPTSPTSPICKSPLKKSDSSGSSRSGRPPLLKQGSADDPKARNKFIKQISNISLMSKKSDNENMTKRRTMSRQASGFGMRQFPYKTLIWFVLTIVFIITYILYLIMSLKVSELYKKDPVPFTVFTSFFRMYFLNNFINPIVYAVLDQKFRKSCKQLGPNIRDGLKKCC